MVTKQSLYRMLDDVRELEARFEPQKRCAFMYCPDYLDKDEVKERHFKLFPEDAEAALLFVTIIEFRNREIPQSPRRQELAWTQIATERMTA